MEQEVFDAKDAIEAIYKELQEKRKHADNTDLIVEINKIISEYVSVEEKNNEEESRQFDISKIDFDLLHKEFSKTKKKNLIIKDLDELVKARLELLLRNNPTRVNFYNRYKDIIKDYNNEQDRASIEKTFNELIALANSLSEEEQRYIKEDLKNNEQLAIYDLLFDENLSANDIRKIKEVSVELLEKINSTVATIDHCFDKEEGQASVKIIIRDLLFQKLPESVFGNYDAYQRKIYDFVSTRYGNIVA